MALWKCCMFSKGHVCMRFHKCIHKLVGARAVGQTSVWMVLWNLTLTWPCENATIFKGPCQNNESEIYCNTTSGQSLLEKIGRIWTLLGLGQSWSNTAVYDICIFMTFCLKHSCFILHFCSDMFWLDVWLGHWVDQAPSRCCSDSLSSSCSTETKWEGC